MNWKNAVAKLNARHYAFPAGWDTRDAIAEQLECSTDRVDTLLGPGLKSGEIEKQQFPVWDARLGRKVLVWGYRQRSAEVQAKPTPAKPTPAKDDAIDEAIRRTARNHPNFAPAQVQKYLSKRIRGLVNTAYIVEVLSK